MPRKSLVNQTKVDKAVSILKRAPTLMVHEAMLLGGFKQKECNTKSIEWKVARSLLGKSKGRLADISMDSRPLSNVDINSLSSWASPLTDPSLTMSIMKENLSPSPPQKLKKQ
jgi:hypothetical protein